MKIRLFLFFSLSSLFLCVNSHELDGLPCEVRAMEGAVLQWGASRPALTLFASRYSGIDTMHQLGHSFRCSGFFISERYFVSNFHCVESLSGSTETWVKGVGGRPFRFDRVVAVSPRSDLAILQTRLPYTGETAVIDSEGSFWSESVYVMGYRKGYLKALRGRIRSKDFDDEIVDLDPRMPNAGGLSGSPVFNASGRVVGVLTYQFETGLVFAHVDELARLASREGISLEFE